MQLKSIATLAAALIATSVAGFAHADTKCGAGTCGKKENSAPKKPDGKEAGCSKKDGSTKEAACSKKEAACSKKDASCAKK